MTGKQKKPRVYQKHRVSMAGLPRHVGRLFLDSGAHSLYSLHVMNVGHKFGYSWYESPAFKEYLDWYAGFVKEHRKSIDWYANVDVIFNPELSWKALKYLEDEHGLNPVPVVHYGTPLRWVVKHLDAGYKLLGVGGLGQEATRDSYMRWADQVYNLLCDNTDRLPVVRTHGFAMTSYKLMIRYPWWSVDSASWAKGAAYGMVFVPHRRNGGFTFGESPYIVAFSPRVKASGLMGKHYNALTKGEKKVVLDWLNEIEMPLGEIDKDGQSVRYGVLSEYNARAIANLKFFEKLCDWLPRWPWPFKVVPRTGFFNHNLTL